MTDQEIRDSRAYMYGYHCGWYNKPGDRGTGYVTLYWDQGYADGKEDSQHSPINCCPFDNGANQWIGNDKIILGYFTIAHQPNFIALYYASYPGDLIADEKWTWSTAADNWIHYYR